MKFEVIVKTEQGLISIITEDALEAQNILNNYRFEDNVNVAIKNRDCGVLYTVYECILDDTGITEKEWISHIWLETIEELNYYGGYSTEEVM